MSRGQGRVYQRGTVWWLDYSLGSRRHREPSTATTKRPKIFEPRSIKSRWPLVTGSNDPG